ncbi:non-canonical purine NTP pyrophosphatase [Bythopirellula polymerisocia]|uniref:dITP/XTP pyrophosphatase n=1 Tax=Bythopirellula polymerisocia TaxID=2528003 RepID=A0A5C6CXU9_9BACT|nr:non-canonical purine NTP pyrophosphatase [Bythopirellula polymerisocia]TWU28301.1 Non-canonical purine NTP pyrophosphatase [Bythopirellula polymerisocia]
MKVEPRRLVIGTTNAHKGRELAELLEPVGFAIQTLKEFPKYLNVVEDGDSFAANACKKAAEQAVYLNAWVMADDSGLEVDALAGAPGIYSARYAGDDAKDTDNNAKLLSELADIPWKKRGALYYCHIAVADPTGAIRAESWGECRGIIRAVAAGNNGFGYDPLFEIREYHQTFGQLGPSVKSAISHRARASRAIVPKLVALADEWQ